MPPHTAQPDKKLNEFPFQFSIGDAEFHKAASDLRAIICFNSLLEMPTLLRGGGCCCGDCPFQFSIGDAPAECSEERERQCLAFQFSIGDAPYGASARPRSTSRRCFNSLLEMLLVAFLDALSTYVVFQFSIGDAMYSSAKSQTL